LAPAYNDVLFSDLPATLFTPAKSGASAPSENEGAFLFLAGLDYWL
jgi:hypothetical protein